MNTTWSPSAMGDSREPLHGGGAAGNGTRAAAACYFQNLSLTDLQEYRQARVTREPACVHAAVWHEGDKDVPRLAPRLHSCIHATPLPPPTPHLSSQSHSLMSTRMPGRLRGPTTGTGITPQHGYGECVPHFTSATPNAVT